MLGRRLPLGGLVAIRAVGVEKLSFGRLRMMLNPDFEKDFVEYPGASFFARRPSHRAVIVNDELVPTS